MSSWRPLLAGTVGLFLIILAFLAGQLRAGADPSVGTRRTPATQQTTQRTTPEAPPDDLTPSAGPPATHQS